MAGDQPAVGVDQKGLRESERLNARHDLMELLFGMGTGIAGVGCKRRRFAPLGHRLEQRRGALQILASLRVRLVSRDRWYPAGL